MTAEFIRTEIDPRGIATLTLARADKHNALSAQMMTELQQAAEALAVDAAVRVVVLAADGPTFCAGGDLRWMKAQREMDAETRRIESARIAHVLGALAALPQPMIGRMQGNTFGGGVGLASVCDVVIGAEGLKMGFTETRLGLIPANIGPYVVARMGAARARQVFMSARIFDAAEAVRLGLVTRVVPAEELDAAVEAEIRPYLQCAPGAVADAKRLLNDLAGRVTKAQVAHAVDALAARWETDEAAEGLAAFFDKRSAAWATGSE